MGLATHPALYREKGDAVKWLWAIVAGVIAWLVMGLRLLPSWLRGKAVLPRAEPVPMPDMAAPDKALQEAVNDATAQAEQAKAPHVVAIEEARATVEAATSTRSKAKRRAMLAKLAAQANKP